MNKKGRAVEYLLMSFFVIIVTSISFSVIEWQFGHVCKIKSLFDEDAYCYHNPYIGRHSNVTGSPKYDGWEIRSHKQDELNRLESERIKEEKRQFKIKQKQCYDSGYFVNESFEVEDYGLTCKKIDYLNDHLMDNFEKRDGGYISGSYSGFLSRGSVKGKSYEYVNERVLATGMLIEDINYHVDCNEVKHNENVDYFTEEEFVMYYVDECVEEVVDE